MDLPGVVEKLDGHAGVAQSADVGQALVTERVEPRGDDDGRGDAAQVGEVERRDPGGAEIRYR